MLLSVALDESHDIFDMVSVREHVDRLHIGHAIFRIEQSKVACLSSRVAADIDEHIGLSIEDDIDHIFVHTGAWGVDNHHIRTAVASHKFVGEDILHVSGIEEGVVQAVDLRVEASVVDGFRHIFDADDLSSIAGHEVGDSAGAGVEVVDQRSLILRALLFETGKTASLINNNKRLDVVSAHEFLGL